MTPTNHDPALAVLRAAVDLFRAGTPQQGHAAATRMALYRALRDGHRAEARVFLRALGLALGPIREAEPRGWPDVARALASIAADLGEPPTLDLHGTIYCGTCGDHFQGPGAVYEAVRHGCDGEASPAPPATTT